jgi:hypothetical protein
MNFLQSLPTRYIGEPLNSCDTNIGIQDEVTPSTSTISPSRSRRFRAAQGRCCLMGECISICEEVATCRLIYLTQDFVQRLRGFVDEVDCEDQRHYAYSYWQAMCLENTVTVCLNEFQILAIFGMSLLRCRPTSWLLSSTSRNLVCEQNVLSCFPFF